MPIELQICVITGYLEKNVAAPQHGRLEVESVLSKSYSTNNLTGDLTPELNESSRHVRAEKWRAVRPSTTARPIIEGTRPHH